MPLKNTRAVLLAPASSAAPQPGEPAGLLTGPHVIAQYLKNLPGSPGVYRMLDAAGTVIYVGEITYPGDCVRLNIELIGQGRG